MAHLKTINRIIGNDFPFMELVKGTSYFYFAPLGSEDKFGTEHKSLLLLATTSVYVNKVSDLTEKEWFLEAADIYQKMQNHCEALREKIKLKKDMDAQGVEYIIKYFEKDGTVNSRNLTAITDGEAKEALTRYSDLKDVKLFKRIA